METQQQTLKVSLKGNFYLVWHIVFHSLVHTYNRALDYKSVSLAHPSSSMRANNASFLLCSACASTSLLLLKIIATILTVAGHSFAWPHLILFCYLSCVACIIINSPVVLDCSGRKRAKWSDSDVFMQVCLTLPVSVAKLDGITAWEVFS